jgi:hypothetical protein
MTAAVAGIAAHHGASPDHLGRATTYGRSSAMASTPMIRADAFGLLPSLLILLLLVLAVLGIVAQAATA